MFKKNTLQPPAQRSSRPAPIKAAHALSEYEALPRDAWLRVLQRGVFVSRNRGPEANYTYAPGWDVFDTHEAAEEWFRAQVEAGDPDCCELWSALLALKLCAED